MKPLCREARGLIELLGKADGPSPEQRAHVERRVAAAVSAGVVTLGSAQAVAGASSALPSLGASGLGAAASPVVKVGLAVTLRALAGWGAAGVGVGAVATSAVVAWEHRAPSAAPALHSHAASTAPKPHTPSVRAQTPSSVPETARAPGELGIAGAKGRPKPESATRSEPWPMRAALAEEMRLLGAAQRELAAGHGNAALEMLDQHERRFPQGVLSEERRGARVLALCSLGRTREARAEARRFLRTSPESPLVPRVVDSCASAAGPIPDGG
jgi:hypothetical protein